MKRVSIKDVAKEAGVSTATVSYVLNGSQQETISAETIERVYKAVRELNYIPNQSARSLISRSSKLIGVIIPQTEPGKEFMFSNPFYGSLLSAIELTARKNGYHLLLSGTQSDQRYVNIARNRDVDGVVVVGTYPSKQLDELKQMDIPIVLIDTYVTDEAFHTIGISDRFGGYMATRHLIDKGHRRIAFVSGSIREHGVNEKRYRGYCEALNEAGIPLDEQLLYIGAVDYDYGIQAAWEWRARKQGETAAFVTSDMLAMGFIKGVKQTGLSVPRDISVVGFDDLEIARMTDPGLTTIHQDVVEKGRCAAQLVIDGVREKGMSRQENILPIHLVERESVKDMKKEKVND